MFVAALWFALHTLAASADTKTPAEATLASLFETPSDVTVTAGGMMVTSPQVRTVMMIKRADDGTLVTTCVTSAAEAESFVHPKIRTADAHAPKQEK
jgi:hypothetical protein